MAVSERAQRRRRRVAPGEFLDEQQQEETIAGLQARAQSQNRLYRVCFAVVLAVPSPLFLLRSEFRAHPRLALLSLVTLACTALATRARGARAARLRLLTAVLGALVAASALVAVGLHSVSSLFWLFPGSMALTAFVIERWFDEVDTEINKLVRYKYNFRGA